MIYSPDQLLSWFSSIKSTRGALNLSKGPSIIPNGYGPSNSVASFARFVGWVDYTLFQHDATQNPFMNKVESRMGNFIYSFLGLISWKYKFTIPSARADSHVSPCLYLAFSLVSAAQKKRKLHWCGVCQTYVRRGEKYLDYLLHLPRQHSEVAATVSFFTHT